MSENLTEFSKALEDVFLNGIIEECVIVIKDGKATIKASDETDAVFVQTSALINTDDCVLGISDLSLFCKYIASINDIPVSIKIDDDKCLFKPAERSAIKYLLAEPELVPSYDEAWEKAGNMVQSEIDDGKYCDPMPLTQNKIDELNKTLGMFSQIKSVYFKVTRRGTVTAHGGKESEHQFSLSIGDMKGAAGVEVQVYGKNIMAVLSTLQFDKNPVLYLGEENDIIISTDTSNWILQPVAQEE